MLIIVCAMSWTMEILVFLGHLNPLYTPKSPGMSGVGHNNFLPFGVEPQQAKRWKGLGLMRPASQVARQLLWSRWDNWGQSKSKLGRVWDATSLWPVIKPWQEAHSCIYDNRGLRYHRGLPQHLQWESKRNHACFLCRDICAGWPLVLMMLR